MTLIGYTMMCEQAGPKQLVRDVALAEEAGFDFAVISDHYFPWLDSQGHSPYAWSVLGAAAQATRHIPLMTYVTCPSRRYHPAVVAQKAATMQDRQEHQVFACRHCWEHHAATCGRGERDRFIPRS